MIEVSNLDFSYKKGVKTIDNLSFSVPKGTIYGFLGANGSGKTTTIRLLLNLCSSENGDILIDKQKINRNSTSVFSRIGTLIESPSFFGHLTGKENLKVFATYYGVSFKRVLETLVMVDLMGDKNTKVGNYSLGMKQRLGLAMSMLHNPDLLILDEPLNGLDPQGIVEIRELLIRLQREEGKTILLSSHLLSEIENTCSSICIIDKGKKLFSGEIADLRSTVMKKEEYVIRCDNTHIAYQILEKELLISPLMGNSSVSFSTDDREIIPEVVRRLAENRIKIYGVSRLKNSLEELYLKLTNNNRNAN